MSKRISQETRYLLPVILPVVLGRLCDGCRGHLAPGGRSAVARWTVAGVLALLAAALFSEAFPVPVENLPGGRLDPRRSSSSAAACSAASPPPCSSRC